MLELLVGNNGAVIPLLLLFITGLLTKQIVPGSVHREVLSKLQEYETVAPKLIEDVNTLSNLVKRIEENNMTAQKSPIPLKVNRKIKGKTTNV